VLPTRKLFNHNQAPWQVREGATEHGDARNRTPVISISKDFFAFRHSTARGGGFRIDTTEDKENAYCKNFGKDTHDPTQNSSPSRRLTHPASSCDGFFSSLAHQVDELPTTLIGGNNE
jgi:hypothetical protein